MFRGYHDHLHHIVTFVPHRRLMTDLETIKIGDTPTIGAGFWAEEWNQPSNEKRQPQTLPQRTPTALNILGDGLRNIIGDCMPDLSGYRKLPPTPELGNEKVHAVSTIRAVAMSGMSHDLYQKWT